MRLILIRHAIAEDRIIWAQTTRPDSERPLTEEGKKRLKEVGNGLRVLVPQIGLILHSPYKRAAQTSQVLGKLYPDTPLQKLADLTPEIPPELTIKSLNEFRDVETLLLVGHEPHLSALLCHLAGHEPSPFFTFKKSGAAAIKFPKYIKPQRGNLLWFMGPRQLAALT